MINWELSIMMHWPHDRFALGWEMFKPEENENFWTFSIFLFIVTIELNTY